MIKESELQSKAALIQLILFDVDGVLTNGHIYFTDAGHEYKAFNSKDGVGIKLLLSTGVEVGVITARQSVVVERRLKELGVKHLYQSQTDKRGALKDISNQLGLCMEQIAYVGDDLPDLPLIRQVGLGMAVSDACEDVIRLSDYVLQTAGGRGAAREACELIMKAQGTWDPLLTSYLI